MKLPKKVKIAHLPTQIKKLERFTKYIDLPVELYVKRDDETGIYSTGNKIRKLEYIAAYAIDHGYDTLVTCGGEQSNHARTTAYVSAYLGLESYLILKGKEPSSYDGNYLLDRLFGAYIRWITEKEYSDNINSIFFEVEEELRKKGKNPLIIPEGASYPLGMFGYIETARELKEQLTQFDICIDYIFSPVGSGGTLGGLLVGQKLFGLDAKVYGINVCDNAEFFKNKISMLIEEFIKEYPEYSNIEISREEINIIDGYVGIDYGIPYKEEIGLIKDLARIEGIILDPTYTGKAFYGLLDLIKKGKIEKGSKILFIHTGGIYSLFHHKEWF